MALRGWPTIVEGLVLDRDWGSLRRKDLVLGPCRTDLEDLGVADLGELSSSCKQGIVGNYVKGLMQNSVTDCD